MKTRHIIMAAMLATVTTSRAQFVIEKTNGTSTTVPTSDASFKKTATVAGRWADTASAT